ncbi:MAG: hypothetical protein L7U68_07145 [Flavobacteriaceae bacterium]|nr:hypothetical protein [Flavobacteriaceae bacterium]
MKRFDFLMIRVLGFCLLLASCSLFKDEIIDDREMVEVAYFVPQYETTAQLAAKVIVESPKDYAEAGKIVTYQNYIFINKPNEGVHVVDNSNPAAPVNLHFINIPGSLDLTIIDDHLYSDMFSALVVFDISDVTQPDLIEDFTVEEVFYYNPYRTLDTAIRLGESFAYTQYESIDDSRGIVTGWEVVIRQEPLEEQISYLRLEDATIAETASSDQANEFNEVSTAGSMTRFLPIGRYLYTINFNELVLFSIGDNYQPTRFARLDTGTQAETLFQLNDLLFVGSTTGMLMYDVTSPSNPNYLNSIEHFRSCDPVVADENYAYVTLRGGTNCFTETNELQIIDIRTPEELSVVARQVMFNPHGLAIHEDYLLVCDGTAGLKVVDVTNRNEPEILSTDNIPFAYDIIVDFPSAIVVGEGVLYQYDLSNLPEIVKTNELVLTN